VLQDTTGQTGSCRHQHSPCKSSLDVITTQYYWAIPVGGEWGLSVDCNPYLYQPFILSLILYNNQFQQIPKLILCVHYYQGDTTWARCWQINISYMYNQHSRKHRKMSTLPYLPQGPLNLHYILYWKKRLFLTNWKY